MVGIETIEGPETLSTSPFPDPPSLGNSVTEGDKSSLGWLLVLAGFLILQQMPETISL
jgi:hypothetical protein